MFLGALNCHAEAQPPCGGDDRETTWTEGGLVLHRELSNPADNKAWSPQCKVLGEPFLPALSHLSHPSCGAGHGRQGALWGFKALVDMMGRGAHCPWGAKPEPQCKESHRIINCGATKGKPAVINNQTNHINTFEGKLHVYLFSKRICLIRAWTCSCLKNPVIGKLEA